MSDETRLNGRQDGKRRVVRKGTQSCWECRRRKIRCSLTTLSRATCDACLRRGTACISQELPDESSTTTVKDRLGRVEAVIESLTRTSAHSSTHHRSPATTDDGQSASTRRRLDSSPPSSPMTSCLDGKGKDRDRDRDLCSQLLAAWPSENEVQLILHSRALALDQFQRFPSLDNLDKDSIPAEAILRAPAAASPPIQVARKLLLLGSFLLRISRCLPQDVGGLSISHRRAMMTRTVETAQELVTSNDNLIDRDTGIECLWIESMYHNNMGNISRAWLVLRRAMLKAQLMGLHRWSKHPDTGRGLDPTQLWFRLVQMDLYLSLMLGFPPDAAGGAYLDTPDPLKMLPPTERMQRIHCVATWRLLRRRRQSDEPAGLEETCEIDRLMQEASSLMPPKWWLCPTEDASIDATGPTHINNLFVHHFVLVRLHLPYLVRRPPDSSHDYSRMTAIHASRQILSWYIFLKSKSDMPYCRGVDFLALLSSAAVCAAHIEARRHQLQDCSTSGFTCLNLIGTQRLADRAMVERVLEIMETMAQDTDTNIDSQMTRDAFENIKSLLEVEAEADSANGRAYICSFSSETEPDGNGDDDDDRHHHDGVLRLSIPSYGTMTVEPCDSSPTEAHVWDPSDEEPQPPQQNLAMECPTLQQTESAPGSMGHSGLWTTLDEPDGTWLSLHAGRAFDPEALNPDFDLFFNTGGLQSYEVAALDTRVGY